MLWKRRAYLDYAAGVSGNPSSPHEEGRRAKTVLEDARTTIARLVEVQSDDVVFTSGATESNALAILGHVRALRLLAGPDAVGRNNIHVLYLPSAHASIVENMHQLASEGVSVEPLPIKNYRVDTEALAKMLRKETALVSMDAVCGETGVVWNTREVADTLKKMRGASGVVRALLHVDASQAPLTEKISRAHFGADMLTFDASKVSDVRGIGAFIAHRTIPIAPLYRGGGQERGLRSGSEAPELAGMFAAALRAAALGREAFRTSATRERARLIKIITHTIPNIYLNESRAQAPNILNLSLSGRDTDYLIALLDEEGFAVSTKSACETLKSAGSTFQATGERSEAVNENVGSRAVLALTGDAERARSTLRISWGVQTRSRTLTRFTRALSRAVAFIDTSGSR